MNLPSGTRLGPYEIVAPLGAGGMGEVYRARDTRLDRTVAVKILPAEFVNDAKFRIRFDREAKTISALNHLFRVADWYDYDVAPDGQRFLISEAVADDQVASIRIVTNWPAPESRGD